MSKIIQYKTVYEKLNTSVAKQVNILIKQGWQPWGSPIKYQQAMVRYEEEPKWQPTRENVLEILGKTKL